ncbi:MAG: adenine-specific DNA-methyltransferase CcrM [Anaerolineae bacterium]
MEFSVNHVFQGDCVEIMHALPEKSVDLIFADPPYNLQLQGTLLRPNESQVDAVTDEWDKFESFEAYDAFTEAWLSACRRVLKDEGTLWVIGSYHNIFRVGNIMMNLGYWLLNDVLWVKTNPMPNFRGTRFANATETLIWAKKSRDQKRYTFNYHAMKHLNDEKQMQNVWHIPLCTGPERIKLDGRKAHSTQKPEALLYRVILASSHPGDVVLDPFFGTGTTGAVAKKLRRSYIGIERDPDYVAVARQRLAAIPEAEVDDALLITPSRRQQPRVSLGQLVEAGYLAVGQTLYSRNRQHHAVIKADSRVNVDGFTGSIHSAAGAIIGRESTNGWDFWYYEAENGTLVSIDALRDYYRRANGLANGHTE